MWGRMRLRRTSTYEVTCERPDRSDSQVEQGTSKATYPKDDGLVMPDSFDTCLAGLQYVSSYPALSIAISGVSSAAFASAFHRCHASAG